MTQSDKTREKLIASIRKTKAPEPAGEPAAAAPKPEAAAPKPETATAPARKPAAAQAKKAQPRKAQPRKSPPAEPANESPAPAADTYSIGGLRWPD
jgi:hypothetical protein